MLIIVDNCQVCKNVLTVFLYHYKVTPIGRPPVSTRHKEIACRTPIVPLRPPRPPAPRLPPRLLRPGRSAACPRWPRLQCDGHPSAGSEPHGADPASPAGPAPRSLRQPAVHRAPSAAAGSEELMAAKKGHRALNRRARQQGKRRRERRGPGRIRLPRVDFWLLVSEKEFIPIP